MKLGDWTLVTPPVVVNTLPVEVNAGTFEHVASFGPYTAKSIVPVGAGPVPLTVAVSWNDPPSEIGVGATAVETVGAIGLIVSVSFAAPHGVVNAV